MIGKPSSPVRREAARKRTRYTGTSPRGRPISLDHRAPPPARDYERHTAVAEAMVRWAAINTITRRIARKGPATRQQRRTLTPTS
jgi:hypothetical protein